jgi:hypothetical protein
MKMNDGSGRLPAFSRPQQPTMKPRPILALEANLLYRNSQILRGPVLARAGIVKETVAANHVTNPAEKEQKNSRPGPAASRDALFSFLITLNLHHPSLALSASRYHNRRFHERKPHLGKIGTRSE